MNISMKKFFLFILFPFVFSCIDNREKIGEEIYGKIIQYQKTNGRLPDGLNEIGVEEKMEGPIYYQKQTDSTFIIYCGGGLGESIVFDPNTKKWKSDRQ
jgi:hypothetical protein